MWDLQYAYELPTLALPTAESGSSSSRVLPTPSAAQNDGHDPERLLPTPTGDDANNVTRESGEYLSLAREAHELAKLLPTPVVTDSFGSRRSTARTEDWESHPGTTLTDAIWEAQDRTTDTTGKLLPTPVANPENPGTGGELRAALTHGENRRNETGVDSFGRPNQGRTPLLPTPHVEMGHESGTERDWGGDLTGAIRRETLLPTPASRDAKGQSARSPLRSDNQQPRSDAERPLADVAKLLPTPLVGDAAGGRTSKGKDRPDEAGLACTVKLLPTPTAGDSHTTRNATGDERGWTRGERHSGTTLTDAVVPTPQLLPTPTGRDHHAQGASRNAGASQTQLSTLVQKYGPDGIPRGAYTSRPSDDGSSSSDGPLPGQLTIEDV